MHPNKRRLRELKEKHSLSIDQICRLIDRSTPTVTQWIVPGSKRSIPDRELRKLVDLLESGCDSSSPRWLHVGPGGRPLSTLENVKKLLDHCGLTRDSSLTVVHSRCNQFGLAFDMQTLMAYLLEVA